MKIGGQKPTPTDIKNAEELMFMMHENVKHKLAKKPKREVPYNPFIINDAFKKLIHSKGGEQAFYQSLENKREELGLLEREEMWKEAMIHQELPDGLLFNKGEPCEYGARCRRKNSVHKFMYHNEETGFKPVTCAPTVVANYMYDYTKE